MYIEDLIQELVKMWNIVNDADMNIVASFNDQIFNDIGFTEKQSVLALRILNRYEKSLSLKLKINVSKFLENPNYRLKIRKSVVSQSIEIIEGNIISVKFPYNEDNIKNIREFKIKDSLGASVVWSKEHTAWHFPLSEQSIKFLMDMCNTETFTFCEQFQNYVDNVETIIDNMANYAPMLAIDDGELKILNSPKNMPKIDTDNILEALFQARNFGVPLWDDNIDLYINSSDVDKTVSRFLKNDAAESFQIDPTESGISALKTIIKYSGPTLVIVPGGSEYDKTKLMVDILQDIGIPEKNMSVLFRLPTETGRIFNDFVKNRGLNGPISPETKVVFISAKLPKPLLKSGVKFNTIINMGYSMAHYTLKEYTKNHQNFINFGAKIKAQGFDFGQL